MRGPGLAHDLRQVVGKANVLDSGVNLPHGVALPRPDVVRDEKETEGVTLVSTRHRPRQFPLHPYTG